MPREQTDVRTGPTKQLAEWLNLNWNSRCGMTNWEVAVKLGFKTGNTVSMWKTGKTRVSIERLFEICDLLNVELEELFPLYIEQDLGDKPLLWNRLLDMLRRMATKGESDALLAIRKALSDAQVIALTPDQKRAFAIIAKDPELAEEMVQLGARTGSQNNSEIDGAKYSKHAVETLVPFAAYYLAMRSEVVVSIDPYQLDFFEIQGLRFSVYGHDCKAAYDLVSDTMSDGEILRQAVVLRDRN